MTRPAYIEAPLNFAVNTGELFVLYPSVGGGPAETLTGEHVLQPVRIRNGRRQTEQFSLDVHGFTFRAHESASSDLYHPGQEYDKEVAALIKELTGAADVLVFDHTLRADSAEVRGERKTRQPAYMVHNDYTERSGPKRMRELLPAGLEDWEQRHFAIINLWRPIRFPVESSPIAICDGRTISGRDLVLTERRAQDRIGEIYQLAFNDQQRWYFFPDMQPGEALIFKCFDSAPGSSPPFAAHTAFEDPGTPPAARPRESIETRTLVFF